MRELLEVIHLGLSVEEENEKRQVLKFVCGKCGRVLDQRTHVCRYCGGQITGIKCQKCGFSGSIVDLRDNCCPKCGAGAAPVKHCSICGEPLPMWRMPKNKRQALWGGWTCPHCGTELNRKGEKIDGAAFVGQPQPVIYQPVPQYAGYPDTAVVRQPKNGLAIAGLVLGIIGVLTSWLVVGLPFCIVGLVLAAVGMRRSEGKGMAIAGLVLSIIGVVVAVTIIVLANLPK